MTDDNILDIQKRYLDGLKHYKTMGVRITIDGQELPENEWDKIFRVAEVPANDASEFYMADFIEAPKGSISEIRLDKVYVRKLDRVLTASGR